MPKVVVQGLRRPWNLPSQSPMVDVPVVRWPRSLPSQSPKVQVFSVQDLSMEVKLRSVQVQFVMPATVGI